MSEHHTTSAGSKTAPPETISKPLSRHTATEAKGNEQVTSGQLGNASAGYIEGNDGQRDDPQKSNSDEVVGSMDESLTPVQKVLMQT